MRMERWRWRNEDSEMKMARWRWRSEDGAMKLAIWRWWVEDGRWQGEEGEIKMDRWRWRDKDGDMKMERWRWKQRDREMKKRRWRQRWDVEMKMGGKSSIKGGEMDGILEESNRTQFVPREPNKAIQVTFWDGWTDNGSRSVTWTDNRSQFVSWMNNRSRSWRPPQFVPWTANSACALSLLSINFEPADLNGCGSRTFEPEDDWWLVRGLEGGGGMCASFELLRFPGSIFTLVMEKVA